MRPNDNLAIVAGAPRRVTLAGVDYQVSKLTPRSAGRIQALLMDAIPDPRDKVRKVMEGLPEGVMIHMWDRACDEARSWPPAMNTPEAQAVFMSEKGMALIVELTVGPNVAGFTPDHARDLVERMSIEDFGALMAVAAPGDPHAPKPAEAATASPGAS